ncbi:serine protease grass-like [Manduca sexta]|uniref:serine protease grass-like n=1 Tax=Manduca sexta TaxID=7130 RepID=UPI00189088A5|nr:serine protease grass-like [Manduca sexta]
MSVYSNVIMFNVNVFVYLFLLGLLGVGSLFAGDGCYVEENQGTCVVLSDCQHLINEIHRAGKPMPIHIRNKLQMLGCGFESDKPMVCCVPPSNFDAINSWTPEIHGSSLSGVPNRGKPTQTDDNVVWGSDYSNSNIPPKDDTDILGHEHDKLGQFTPSDRVTTTANHRNIGLLPTDCGSIESDRIIGGNRTRLFEMPWMVLLSYQSGRRTRLDCGGTLINEWYVLTAAHCVTSLRSNLILTHVILGEHDVEHDPDCERSDGNKYCAPPIKTVTIEETIPHPRYNSKTFADDIALLRLSEPADFNLDNMKPLCLPLTSQLQTENLVNINGIVAGWGVTEEGMESSVLLSVSLPILSKDECETAYKGTVQLSDKQLCAGGVRDKDSCGGDSGGPLMYPGKVGSGGIKYIQRGIVSYGTKRCGVGGFPGVYTNVASYMDWILDNMHS